MDFIEFNLSTEEDDDDDVSRGSTVNGDTDELDQNIVDADEDLAGNDESQEKKPLSVSDSLKRLGSVRKKAMSKNILCDMLGSDGGAMMKNLIKSHRKSLWRDKQKLQRIVHAVQFFERRMNQRREILHAKRKVSAEKR